MRSTLLSTLALLCLLHTGVGGSQTIPWSAVPQLSGLYSLASASLPTDCVCITNDVPCTKYECNCVCDVHARACDPGCCCDSECSAAETARTRALGACLPEGPVNATLRTCVSLENAAGLVAVNPQARMVVDGTPGADRVLCISVDNNPLRSQYYRDPGLQDASIFTRADIERSTTYVAPTRTTTAATASFFDTGVLIPAATGSASALVASRGGGVWTIPVGPTAGGMSSACGAAGGGGAGKGVRFRQDVPMSQCFRSLPMNANTCATLTAAAVSSSLFIGTAPNSVPSSPSGYLGVTLGSAYTMNRVNGSLVPISGAPPAALFTNTSSECTCANAVVGVTYRPTYSATYSTITGVAVDIVLADMSQPAAACALGRALSVPLTTAVTFTADAASLASITTSYDASNLLPSERSGAPGYTAGAPVLGGVMVTESGAPVATADQSDRKAVARSAKPHAASLLLTAAANATGVGTRDMGLYLRGAAPGGACAALPTVAASATGLPVDTAAPVSVTFAEDVVAGCTLSLTLAELQSLCTATGTLPFMGLGTVDTLGSADAASFAARLAFSHVGVFGNADPLKPWEWLQIDVPATLPSAPFFSADTQTCAAVITGVALDFLVTLVGDVRSPQRKIIAARMRYLTDTWTFTADTLADARQSFSLRSVVTWTTWSAEAQDYVPPAPPIVPPLPADLFFPFVTSTSTDAADIVSSAAPAFRLHGAVFILLTVAYAVVALAL